MVCSQQLCFGAAQNFVMDVGRLLHVTGLKSAAYVALSVGFFAAAAGYLVKPETTLTGVLTYARSRDCILLWQAIGAGALMLPAWTFSLKACTALSPPCPCCSTVALASLMIAGNGCLLSTTLSSGAYNHHTEHIICCVLLKHAGSVVEHSRVT